MGKLKLLNCKHLGAPLSRFRFMFEDRLIDDEETPKFLKMMQDDIIDVYHFTTGDATELISLKVVSATVEGWKVRRSYHCVEMIQSL